MRGGQKLEMHATTMHVSDAVFASETGIDLSNICPFFNLSMHLSTCIQRLAIVLLCLLSSTVKRTFSFEEIRHNKGCSNFSQIILD